MAILIKIVEIFLSANAIALRCPRWDQLQPRLKTEMAFFKIKPLIKNAPFQDKLRSATAAKLQQIMEKALRPRQKAV